MKLEITDAKPFHCGQIARSMRVDHHRLLLSMNVPIHRDLRSMFDGSYYRRAAFIDGTLSAIWGVESTPVNSDGRVWLVLSQHAIKHPMTIIRQARRELTHLAGTKSCLTTTVIADDEPAIRLAIMLGFQVENDPEGLPAMDREGRNRLMRYLKSNPDLLVPAGGAQQIGIIWRPEAMA